MFWHSFDLLLLASTCGRLWNQLMREWCGRRTLPELTDEAVRVSALPCSCLQGHLCCCYYSDTGMSVMTGTELNVTPLSEWRGTKKFHFGCVVVNIPFCTRQVVCRVQMAQTPLILPSASVVKKKTMKNIKSSQGSQGFHPLSGWL